MMQELVEKAKAFLDKATETVTGLVKKDEGGGEIRSGSDEPEPEPTEHSQKMKAAVEEAKKARGED